jgi:hypothetical protein
MCFAVQETTIVIHRFSNKILQHISHRFMGIMITNTYKALFKISHKLGMVVYAYTPSTQKAEEGG